jgi:hypothetical protein
MKEVMEPDGMITTLDLARRKTLLWANSWRKQAVFSSRTNWSKRAQRRDVMLVVMVVTTKTAAATDLPDLAPRTCCI